MANVVLTSSDLVKILDPGSVTTRAAFGKARKPWTPGYTAQYAASAQARLVGVNLPGASDISKTSRQPATGAEVMTFSGGTTSGNKTITYTGLSPLPVSGQAVFGTGLGANNFVDVVTPGTGFTVTVNSTATATVSISTVTPSTVPTGVTYSLPTTSDITDASNYANAFLLAYAPGDRSNAVLVPRVGTTGAGITGPFWRAETATTFTVVASGALGAYVGYPANTVFELIVPAAADINVLINNATGNGSVKVYDLLVSGATSNTGIITLNRVFR